MEGKIIVDWTFEAVERLRALWAEGHSTAEIGRRMGISKNAVIGKARRLNLTVRPSPIRRGVDDPLAVSVRPRRVKDMVRVPTRAVSGPTLPVVSGSPVIPVTGVGMNGEGSVVVRQHRQVDRQPRGERSACCWPIGKPGQPGFRFCGAEANPKKSYCDEHAAIATRKPRRTVEEVAKLKDGG